MSRAALPRQGLAPLPPCLCALHDFEDPRPIGRHWLGQVEHTGGTVDPLEFIELIVTDVAT
jgi:hypothetical protein